MENLDYKYHPEVNDDYVVPDIMLVCDRKGLKHSAYHGTPKFYCRDIESGDSTQRQDGEERDL